eukprot:TRINITY_DN2952_c0_g1_i3.p1 TRINITY_DN2952_c0_g1~~TRINITY_DN2952_c0_g1_i3.p1  ORF type:complete len:307 (+),score=62.07 TRINITY_DN2952_c0_g1_i3:68-988(+)
MRFSLMDNAASLLALLGGPFLTLQMKAGWAALAKYYFACLLVKQIMVFKKLMTPTRRDIYVLETIGVSHYVETVRFCMDYKGIPYEEEENAGILGVLFTGRTVPRMRHGKNVIGDSKDILRYLYGQTNDGFFEPTEAALQLETKIDLLAQHLRRWVYYNALCREHGWRNGVELWGLYMKGVPLWQKAVLLTWYPVVRWFLLTILKINKATAARSHKKTLELMAEISSVLSDGRQYLLNTPSPTFTDMQFASIVGPFEAHYNPGKLNPSSAVIFNRLPKDFQEDFTEMLDTPAGRHAQMIYARFRVK